MTILEKASIIIITYNNEADIEVCLHAIYQNTQYPFELIVFDNASEDNTVAIVSEKFPQINLIAHSANVGFAQGNNEAAHHAESDFVVFLNPDTIVQKGWLAPLIDSLQQESDIGAVTSQILFADPPNRINACGNNVYLSGMTYCQFLGNAPVTKPEPFSVGAVSGAAFAMKRPLFEKIGGFVETFFMYYEDTDLSLRLNYLGWRCVVIPKSVVWHNYQSTFHANKVYYLERNRYMSLLSLLHWGLLVLMFPAILWSEVVTWGYCFLQQQGAIQAKVQSWRDIWSQLQWIRHRRKQYAKWSASKQLLTTMFVSRLDAGYAAENQLLGQIVSGVSWLLAFPILMISRLF